MPHILIFFIEEINLVFSCPEIIIPGTESAQALITPVIELELPAPAVTNATVISFFTR